ncbi:hypothetical protein [Parafrankia sp. EAN1pec]
MAARTRSPLVIFCGNTPPAGSGQALTASLLVAALLPAGGLH